jgi:2-hydroxy-3-keto-5-methylthiopentenyl-1-phosphate phosphatase
VARGVARLVLDWDGTCTEVDALHLVLERFGDRGIYERVERQLLAGEISYRELMETEFATVSAPVVEVNAFLARAVRLRSGFRTLAERYRPLILSGGFHELIEPVLAREGLDLVVRANRLDARADGWRIRWRDDATCPECGDYCKRRGLPDDGEVVFVGDGYSDRCAALAADRVFARDGLAAYLSERGDVYEVFDSLDDVVTALS